VAKAGAFAYALLTGSYDCVDRIVLNSFFRMGHGPGGFRVWWQAPTGSEETLDNAHLTRLAGRFSRHLHGYAKANGIPIVHFESVRPKSVESISTSLACAG
jgi:hypothetical protein